MASGWVSQCTPVICVECRVCVKELVTRLRHPEEELSGQQGNLKICLGKLLRRPAVVKSKVYASRALRHEVIANCIIWPGEQSVKACLRYDGNA